MNFNVKKVLTIVTIALFSEFAFIGCSSRASGSQVTATAESEDAILISKFDPILRRAAEQAEMDWLFLSAIAYTESRFNSEARSRVGAVGLMQVMPSVARGFGSSPTEALNPEVNVELAVKVLQSAESTLRFGNTPMSEKVKILLACYNSGIGNVIEARKEAAAAGVNHNHWDTLKNYGAFQGTETPAFVNNVMSKWEQYKKMYS